MNVLEKLVEEVEGGIKLRIYVKTESSKEELRLEYGEIVFYTPEPPIAGRANASLKRFLSKIFNVPSGKVEITYGLRGKVKTVIIRDVSKEHAIESLKKVIKV